eukprot:3114583-Ditylum_brightwellii.AAC.1
MGGICNVHQSWKDIFLDSISRGLKIKLMGAFVIALCEVRFSGKSYDFLDEDTVRGALSYMAQAIPRNDHPNPTNDKDGKLRRVLLHQFRVFKNKDPKPNQQKTLPIGVLRVVAKAKATKLQKAITQLLIGDFFFACRSCEYLKKWKGNKAQQSLDG